MTVVCFKCLKPHSAFPSPSEQSLYWWLRHDSLQTFLPHFLLFPPSPFSVFCQPWWAASSSSPLHSLTFTISILHRTFFLPRFPLCNSLCSFPKSDDSSVLYLLRCLVQLSGQCVFPQLLLSLMFSFNILYGIGFSLVHIFD